VIPIVTIGKNRCKLRAPFHPRLAPELKREIPVAFRSWDRKASCWRWDVRYLEQAKRALYRCFNDVAFDDGKTYRVLDRNGRETAQGSLL
jgi:hypothetical protein